MMGCFRKTSLVECSGEKEIIRWLIIFLQQHNRTWGSSYLDGEQHGEELALVSDQHGVADDRHRLLHGVLDGHRGNVLSSGSDDELCHTHTHTHDSHYIKL